MKERALALAWALLFGCETTARPSDAVETSRAPVIELAPVPATGPVSLEEALHRRRSVRSFTSEPLTRDELGRLLWAAQGVTSSEGFRTAPSAGATFPLELYVATPEGVLHYVPLRHEIEKLSNSDIRGKLARASGGQRVIASAAAVLVVAAVRERTQQRYGARAELYVSMEAGHAAQNVLLMATRLGLGATPVGAFLGGDVNTAASLPRDREPLYLIALGRPR